MSAIPVSGSASSSSFSSPSCLDTCVRSLPLKIISCIPIIGIATTILAAAYANNSLQQNLNAINVIKNTASGSQSAHEEVRLGRECIEWAQVSKDHCLASVIREVASIALIILGITAGGAVNIGINVGFGIVWFCLSRRINNEMEKISTAVALLETAKETQKNI